MIVTTTPSVEGKTILEYKGIVFGEVISGVNWVRDLTAGLSNFFGGRSGTYEEELTNARETALRELEIKTSPDAVWLGRGLLFLFFFLFHTSCQLHLQILSQLQGPGDVVIHHDIFYGFRPLRGHWGQLRPQLHQRLPVFLI